MYDLMTSKFDVDEHIKNYPFYTEVVIFPDGHIEYATPFSSREALSSSWKYEKLDKTRSD